MLNLNWFKSSSIRAKVIILPVLGILAMCAIAGANKHLELSKKRNIELGRKSQAVGQGILRVMMIEEQFINRHDIKLLSEYKKHRDILNKAMVDVKSIAVDDKMHSLANKIIGIEKDHAQIFSSITQNIKVIDTAKTGLVNKTQQMNTLLSKIITAIDQEEAYLIMEGDFIDAAQSGARTEIKDYLGYGKERILKIQNLFLFSDINNYKENKKDLEKKVNLAKKNVGHILNAVDSAEFIKIWNEAAKHLAVIKKLEDAIFVEWTKNMDLMSKLKKTGVQVQDAASEIVYHTKTNIEKNSRASDRVSLGVALAGIIILLILSYFISKSINRSLNTVIDDITESAHKVASASGQVSSASHSLAEGASEQAASIEETASSLEEMSTMTRQNAENANQADNLTKEANQIVSKANDSMTELTTSMNAIFKASEEISKIIKTIDEIAFQTNLLALNAAVEAARAGEAGAGFAVVADEVRTLAMRAADAAKDTAELIEGTIKKINDGTELVVRTNEAFTDVSTSSEKLGELVGEISAASYEQSQGIEQVNLAVAEMDKVVQNNAANSEESASASEEMNAQAEQMKGMVFELVTLVGGNSNGNGAGGKDVTQSASAEQK